LNWDNAVYGNTFLNSVANIQGVGKKRNAIELLENIMLIYATVQH